MDYSVNTRPLLEKSDSESESEDVSESQQIETEDAEDVDVSLEDTNPLFKISNPRDRYHAAYFIFYLLGMTTLLPWNFFITADQYWMFKFHEVPHNTTLTKGRTVLQAEFASYLSVASNVPNTIFLIINTLFSHKVPLRIRMIGSFFTILLLFILTTSFVKVDTDPWQQSFFILTLSTVVVVNIGCAILQGGLYGVVGCFPHRYITAVVGGQALGGVFAALANIASLTLGASPETSALAYFLVADVVLASALVAYLTLSSSSFFKFYIQGKSRSEPYSPAATDEGETPPAIRHISYKIIFKKIWIHCFTIWMLFVVTLAVFPAVTVLISSVDEGNKRPWNDVYFVPVVGYLLFNSCDYVGRLLAGWLHRPRTHSWILGVVSILRAGFVPLLMLCNANPRKNLPVVIDNDLWYILIIVLFALSNGYLANISFISVASQVNSSEQETAASMMAAFLGIGTSCGSALSLMMVRLL